MTPTTPPQKKNPLLKKMFSGITDQQSLFNLGVQQERHRIEEIIEKLDMCELNSLQSRINSAIINFEMFKRKCDKTDLQVWTNRIQEIRYKLLSAIKGGD